MSLWNFGGACWNFSQITGRPRRKACLLLLGVLPYFAFLAEAADRFAQTHGESGDGLQALLAAVREATVIFWFLAHA